MKMENFGRVRPSHGGGGGHPPPPPSTAGATKTNPMANNVNK